MSTAFTADPSFRKQVPLASGATVWGDSAENYFGARLWDCAVADYRQ